MVRSDSESITITVNKLIHYPLCPLSRFMRILCSEYGFAFDLVEERFWEKREAFLLLNPSGKLPILIENKKNIICDVFPIFEYMMEKVNHNKFTFMPQESIKRAEVRRILSWFHIHFYQDVSYPLLFERVIKRNSSHSTPDSSIIRKALLNLPIYLEGLASLLSRRDWLGGEEMSVADFAGMAHFSVVDFLGNIQWDDPQQADVLKIIREWYAQMKSRPSFRDVVKDKIEGFTPPHYYRNPDF